MSRQSRIVALCSVSLAVIACLTSVLLIARASSDSPPSPVVPTFNKGGRNLALHPEAFRVALRLGNRFDASSGLTSIQNGNLTIAESEQPVVITRRQSDTGETVEMRLVNSLLTWSLEDGLRTSASTLNDTERLLAERLIFDSPDHFVLAQLRGASYFTVARSVRPPDAPDDYSGPLWTIVRVDERRADASSQPGSSWRLYYINSNTGLIDRIVSRLGEQTIEAWIVSWTEQSGERAPAQIRWTIESREVMSYRATSVSHRK